MNTQTINEAALPDGPVSLFITDIEGSTRLLKALGDDYAKLVVRHREIIRNTVSKCRGAEVDTQGDAYFGAFRHAVDAVNAAVQVQRQLHEEDWPQSANVRVRIGIHTGSPKQVDGSYFGLDVHRAARIAASSNGGQVLLSTETRNHLDVDKLPDGTGIRELGAHRLKDITFPEILYDLTVAGLDCDFGPVNSLDNRPNNLPSALTTFVGRRDAVAEVRDILCEPDTRILTLTGPGGMGKTRLSIEAANASIDQFRHGVFQVQLASITDPELVILETAETLGIKEFAGQSPLDNLCHRLADRETLIILDNFEQVVDAADMVLEVIQRCPGITILVTSRETLDLRAEKEYPVQPLEIPEIGATSIDEIESVRLLVERVRNFDPEFSISEANEGYIAEICRRMDGLPLALELAASRLQLMSPKSLCENLDSRIKDLKGTARDLPVRQRTLENTIDWSYQLLEENEKKTFRHASVFSGGFSPESAHAVFGDQLHDVDAGENLLSLVKKSLLVRGNVQGEPRMRMLQIIREFAADRLAADSESDAARRKHAHHYLTFAESKSPGLIGGSQRECVTALSLEEGNVRAALKWAIEEEESNIAARIISALLWSWIPQGQFVEGKSWTSRALSKFTGDMHKHDAALIGEAKGWLEVLGGNYLECLPYLEQSMEYYKDENLREDLARVQTPLGLTYTVIGDDRGVTYSDESLAYYRKSDDAYRIALALISVGSRYHIRGEEEPASQKYEEALEYFARIGNSYWPGQLLQNLAHFRLNAGDWRRASELALDALNLAREYNYPMILNLSIAAMGGVAVARSMPNEAARLFGAVNSSLAALGAKLEPPDQAAMDAYAAVAKDALSPEDFEKESRIGANWSNQELIEAAGALRR